MNTYQILISLCLLTLAVGKLPFLGNNDVHWAVLVAGSNDFWNYRHQSDVYHAYQVLLKNGMNPDNIIVFAFDDIANNSENPMKGKVFNKPDPTGKGVDVYAGVKIDYKGELVTPENFLNVIQGEKAKLKGKGTGRVLQSKSTDNVFIYFSDHGANGLIAFPSEELYADDLNKALLNMHTKKMYRKLVFYLEACESGSMFENLLHKNLNIYSTTASTPSESSWATYCSPDDKVNGTSIGTCLGDEYSVNWIENADDLIKNNKESLLQQFNTISEKTVHSKAQQYGDFSFLNETASDFEGYSQSTKFGIFRKVKKVVKNTICKIKEFFNLPCEKKSKKFFETEYLDLARKSVVDSRKVKVAFLLNKVETTNDRKYEDMLKIELDHIRNTDFIFEAFNNNFQVKNEDKVQAINFDCLRQGVESYKNICKNWGEYDLAYVRNISNACKNNNAGDIKEFFSRVCKN